MFYKNDGQKAHGTRNTERVLLKLSIVTFLKQEKQTKTLST